MKELLTEWRKLYKESSDWYSDEYETLADKKFADQQRWEAYEDAQSSTSPATEEIMVNHYISIYENEGIQGLIDELHANPPQGVELDDLLAAANDTGYGDITFTLEELGMIQGEVR